MHWVQQHSIYVVESDKLYCDSVRVLVCYPLGNYFKTDSVNARLLITHLCLNDWHELDVWLIHHFFQITSIWRSI